MIDKKGKPTKLPAKVKNISDFNAKYIIFDNGDDEYGVMDYDGNTIVDAKYSCVMFVDNDTFFAIRDKNAYILDPNGKEKLEISDFKFKDAHSLGKFGLIGDDDNSFTMLNDEGKERNKNCKFYGTHLGYCLCNTIE